MNYNKHDGYTSIYRQAIETPKWSIDRNEKSVPIMYPTKSEDSRYNQYLRERKSFLKRFKDFKCFGSIDYYKEGPGL